MTPRTTSITALLRRLRGSVPRILEWPPPVWRIKRRPVIARHDRPPRALKLAQRFIDVNSAGRRVTSALAALAAFAAGGVLALQHPLHPELALIAFVLWCSAAIRWRALWLFVLPACLPAANLSPWTGWIAFDEFDLIVLGAIAGGFANLASSRANPRAAPAERSFDQLWFLVPSLCFGVALLGLARGLAADGAGPIGWYDGYRSPLNALRVGKSLLLAVPLLPLIRRELCRSECAAIGHIAAGMLVGTGIVALATVAERIAYVGLFDFSRAYRTTALFWEMHVGGAAIDGYLALAWPVVAWAVLRAQTPSRWAPAAMLAVFVEYACLTTFSRGLYVAVAGGIVVLFMGLKRQAPPSLPRWRRRADAVLAAVLVAQLIALVGAETFMRARLNSSETDLAKRLVHWRHGIDLLRTPTDWWLGKGSGRLPFEYGRSVPEDEFPGSMEVVPDSEGAHLDLTGPNRDSSLAGRYAITQQVPVEAPPYRVAFDVRVFRPVRLGISVCTMHLLYEGSCQRATVQVFPDTTPWQRLTLPLTGPMLSAGIGLPRTAVFAITVLDVNASVSLDNISLESGRLNNMLRNADFSAGLAHWFPVAKDYFVPWHIDNFYLELLIEQGIFGLASVALLIGSALARLGSVAQRASTATPYLMASLVGALLVGTVSSVIDMPRVAFLLFFLSLTASQLGTVPRIVPAR
jgi:hypothetical protein